MVKKQQTKSALKKGKPKAAKSKSRLAPGKKQCKNCSIILPIHTKKCTGCGFVHQMKKGRQQIMKNLNKITPIIIKSIIESNQFNEFKAWQDERRQFEIGELDEKQREIQASLTRKKSQPKKKKIPDCKQLFKETNLQNFKYMKGSNPITSLAVSNEFLIYVESLKKQPIELSKNQEMTIQAFQLQNYHCLGVNYQGQSRVRVLKKDIPYCQINIPYHISQIKVFSNMVAALTGQSTLLIFSFNANQNPVAPQLKKNKKSKESNHQESIKFNQYQLINQLEIREAHPDRITSFEWLRNSVDRNFILIAVGTFFGHISIYKIYLKEQQTMEEQNQISQQYSLVRYIPKAHFEWITCLSECPLKSDNKIIFVSGCNDGSIKIWDVNEPKKLLECNITNRKIWRIFWDPGAKYIMVDKDQSVQNLVIICFYSINKIEETVFLSSTAEIRLIKKHFPQHLHNAKIIISQQSYDGKYIGLVDAVNGYFRVVSLEQLRSTSLKKKKTRQGNNISQGFKLQTLQPDGGMQISQLDQQQQQENQANGNKIADVSETGEIIKRFPIICDVAVMKQETVVPKLEKHLFYIATYHGEIIQYSYMES